MGIKPGWPRGSGQSDGSPSGPSVSAIANQFCCAGSEGTLGAGALVASATALLGTAIVDDGEEVVVATAAVNATSARVVVGSTTVTTACTEVGGVATDGSGRPVHGPLVQPKTLAAASATPIERRLTANSRRRADIPDGLVWKPHL